MNVLHLHLSDWAGVRFAVDAYPELTAGLNGQFYTAADAADLVAYAKERAVRIVPEVRPSEVLYIFLIHRYHSISFTRAQGLVKQSVVSWPSVVSSPSVVPWPSGVS
jgi:hypothetical protein